MLAASELRDSNSRHLREKDLKDLPGGHERELAYRSERKRGFWILGGPVDFEEAVLPEPGSEMNGSLRPPKMPRCRDF